MITVKVGVIRIPVGTLIEDPLAEYSEVGTLPAHAMLVVVAPPSRKPGAQIVSLWMEKEVHVRNSIIVGAL